MLSILPTPLIRLSNLFPDRSVYAKCEFLGPSGSFKIRGAAHLLEHLSRTSSIRDIVVPSMGNTALGAAVAAKAYGFEMIGVVPQTISRAKDEKLGALGVELQKIAGGGSDLLRHAKTVAADRGAYFVHPHLDQDWTSGYGAILDEIMDRLPACRTLVIPLGGGGLLMGLTERDSGRTRPMRTYAIEPYNYPKYARFEHQRTATIADGLILEFPHPPIQERIRSREVCVDMVTDDAIRTALTGAFREHALVIEPSSATTLAFVFARLAELVDPICVILTGSNIAREDFNRLLN